MASRSRKRLKRRKISPETTQLDGSDGIFQLPDDILKHLLSYLPFEDSVSLSAVSKTWRRICNSLPVLEFNFDLEEELEDDDDITLEDFVTSINKSLSSLRNHRAIIESFCLSMDPSEEEGLKLKSNLNDWLSLIMKNHVKEIDFAVSNSSDNIYFTVPQSVFTSKSLVKLHLKGCKFPTNVSLTDKDNDGNRKSRFNKFNCLKEISLVNVVARDDQIQELINLARDFLQYLLIKTFPPVKLLSLESFAKLDSIDVNVKKLYVNQAMKLDDVVLYGLKRAYLYRVDNIRTLRCLKWYKSAFRSIQALVSGLPFLETLQLFMVRNQRIRIQSRHLKTLLLYECQRFEEPLVVDLNTPGLKTIKFNGFCVPFITVYGENQHLRCRHLGHPCGGVHGSNLHMLGKFSQNLMQSMVIIHLHEIVMIENGENVVKTLEELRGEPEVPRPSNVKMLVIECIPVASDYKSFLNALFWTCHPRTLVVMLTTKQTLKSPHRLPFISYLTNELALRRGKYPTCCSEPNKPKCWRHYVEQVKFNEHSYRMSKQFGHEELQDLLSDDHHNYQMPENYDIFDDDVDENDDDDEEEVLEAEKIVAVFKIVWRPYPYSFRQLISYADSSDEEIDCSSNYL